MNEAQSLREKNLHEFRVTNRKQMSIDGVKDVIGFDETEVELLTVGGDMTVEGSDLRVKVLDVERGVVTLEGRLTAFFIPKRQEEKKEASGRVLSNENGADLTCLSFDPVSCEWFFAWSWTGSASFCRTVFDKTLFKAKCRKKTHIYDDSIRAGSVVLHGYRVYIDRNPFLL